MQLFHQVSFGGLPGASSSNGGVSKSQRKKEQQIVPAPWAYIYSTESGEKGKVGENGVRVGENGARILT